MTERHGIDPDQVEHALALLDGFVRAHLYAGNGDLEFAPAVPPPAEEDHSVRAAFGPAVAERLNLAHLLLTSRQLRGAYFAASLFGEPAQDLLLEIYVRQVGGHPVPIAHLRALTQVPANTASRWITILVNDRTLERISAVGRERGDSVRLSDDSFERMEHYLDAVLRESALFPRDG